MSQRITVQLQVQPGQSAAFEGFMAEATARVRAEDAGCEQYHLFRSLDEETRYVLIESWATAEDLAAHGSAPAIEQLRGMRAYLAGAPEVHRYEDE